MVSGTATTTVSEPLTGPDWVNVVVVEPVHVEVRVDCGFVGIGTMTITVLVPPEEAD